jgi:UDP-N-acetylmuramoyl-tripeptide--D-alanyl-D-alanine ligase
MLQKQGVAFVNAADEVLMIGSNQIKNRITYVANENHQAHYQAHIISLQPTIEFKVKDLVFKSHLSGDYNLENIMAALAIGYEFGLSSEQISAGIAQYKPQNLRSEYLETTRNKIFLDAYNANPSSMEASIRNFAALPGENKLLILGDMFELGKYEAEEHQYIADYCHKIGLKNVAFVGHAFSATKTDFLQFSNISDLISNLKLNQLHGYFVFLKGSRGMRLENLMEHL